MYFYYYELTWSYDEDYHYCGIVAAETYGSAMRSIEKEFLDGEIIECTLRLVGGGEHGMLCFSEEQKADVLNFVNTTSFHSV